MRPIFGRKCVLFDQILVPVDQSLLAENILPHTFAMAHAYGSEVALISVLDPVDHSSAGLPIDPWEWQNQRAEAAAYLADLSSYLQSYGLMVKPVLLEGSAPDNLIQRSDKMGTSLIMLSSHGQGGISSWNTSSVVTKIIQQAHTSVMLIRSNPVVEQNLTNLSYRRILVPIDGSRRSEYGLFAAARLARAHDAELLVVSVIKPPEIFYRSPVSARESALVQQIVESNRAEAIQNLEAVKASLDCKVDTCIITNRSVPEALHNLIEQEKIDLVILTAHGFSGNPRRSYGNVTTNFLAYSTTPLLIIQDFERELLRETKAGTNENELPDWQSTFLFDSRQRFSEVHE